MSMLFGAQFKPVPRSLCFKLDEDGVTAHSELDSITFSKRHHPGVDCLLSMCPSVELSSSALSEVFPTFTKLAKRFSPAGVAEDCSLCLGFHFTHNQCLPH